MLQDTFTADGAFSHAFKAYQLPICNNDPFARDQNHEKKHHPPSSIASVFQVSCSMQALTKFPAPSQDQFSNPAGLDNLLRLVMKLPHLLGGADSLSQPTSKSHMA